MRVAAGKIPGGRTMARGTGRIAEAILLEMTGASLVAKSTKTNGTMNQKMSRWKIAVVTIVAGSGPLWGRRTPNLGSSKNRVHRVWMESTKPGFLGQEFRNGLLKSG